MDKRLFILTLMTAAALAAYAQTPLNRLDSFYFAGETEAAAAYAEEVLGDPQQSVSQKKAVSAYLEMRRKTDRFGRLPAACRRGRDQRAGLRRRLVRAGVEPYVCRQHGAGIFVAGGHHCGKK